jgi:chromosome segregation ATPase
VAEVNHRLRAEKIKLEGELNELRKTVEEKEEKNGQLIAAVEEKEVKNRQLIVDLQDLQDQKERSSQDKVKRLQKEVDVLKKVHCRHFSSISVTKNGKNCIDINP